ncbi:MAG: fructose-1,6-bisphosphatase [Clostridiales bacterium]|nr:fructose-1,6-bisphosphatase [Clostridiales bacterium]
MEYNIEYLQLLKERYPNIQLACAEIIALESRMKLPKLTEHFMSDIHGEHESFLHILRNASGVIKEKIDNVFERTLSEKERDTLSTIIYYPERKLDLIKQETDDIDDWYKITLYRLIEVCRLVASKYTRSDIRELLPKTFGSIIDELLHADTDFGSDKEMYYAQSILSIVELGQADAFIVEIAHLIQNLAIGRLHIIGDIFDRGPRADIILDRLLTYHNVDIQWGNHDVEWMGAAAGNLACIANVIAISTKYCNFDCIEDGYGINLRPLTVFALETYADDPCTCFIPRNPNSVDISKNDEEFWAKLHKAISIIRFKLEGQIILRHPEFLMENHLMLDKINYTEGTITLDGKTHRLLDTNFPTVNTDNPYELTPEETELMKSLRASFMHSEKLQRHIRFMYSKGSMYLVCNNNLLYHGCIPMMPDGEFAEYTIDGKSVKGKALLDRAEKTARVGYFGKPDSAEKQYGEDFLWYLWCGIGSPVYGKNKMTSFERYFIADEDTWAEIKDPYYKLVGSTKTCEKILSEFGVDPNTFSHIINGHVPVMLKKGESPVRAGGKLLVIDGGLSKAYQEQTGIAGYTLLFNSHGLLLSEHNSFDSVKDAVTKDIDIKSSLEVIDIAPTRLLIEDTDLGKQLHKKINDLRALVDAFRRGIVK